MRGAVPQHRDDFALVFREAIGYGKRPQCSRCADTDTVPGNWPHVHNTCRRCERNAYRRSVFYPRYQTLNKSSESTE
jgi:hypothetical protein